MRPVVSERLAEKSWMGVQKVSESWSLQGFSSRKKDMDQPTQIIYKNLQLEFNRGRLA